MTKHIVIIDDCQVTLAMASDYLTAAGYDVATAECGVYANHLIYGRQAPDLILLDLVLPLMSGEKKARLLKFREKSRHIPILLMSSRQEEELQRITAMSGADGYITKPFTADDLVRTVRTHLCS
jgi:DNA-binding response OmpR family regulator